MWGSIVRGGLIDALVIGNMIALSMEITEPRSLGDTWDGHIS